MKSFVWASVIVIALANSGYSYSNEPAKTTAPGTATNNTDIELSNSTNFTQSYAGIYAVDSRFGLYRDAGIRDYDYVDGYAWRYSWAAMEPSQGVYDFAAVEHIIGRLADLNQRLSWLTMDDIPSYISEHPDVTTWDNAGKILPVPWDDYLLLRYDAFISALANHPIPDPAVNNEPVPLKDHSAMAVLHPSFPGTPRGGIRDSTVKIANIPGYTRDKFLLDSVRPVINSFSQHFPNKALFVSLWPVSDSNRNPKLWQATQSELANYSHVGVWMDNLAASRECVECTEITGRPMLPFGSPLMTDHNFAGFQMLTSWAAPFTSNHAAKVAFASPMEGMKWGLDQYGAKYFEIYPNDLDNPLWVAGFEDWHAQLSLSQ